MRVLIIGSSKAAPTADDRTYYGKYLQFFEESAARTGAEVEIATALLEDLIIEAGEGTFRIYDAYNQRELTDYAALILRGGNFRTNIDIITTINEFAQRHDIQVINRGEHIRVASKLLQAVHFECIGVPVARTLAVNEALLNHFDMVADWSFPSVMKARFGSHGNDNYVVSSLDEMREILARDPEIGYVLQRFVPNDGDYRILLVGGETLVIGRTSQGNSHLNNTSQGGVASEIDPATLPAGMLDDARKIADYYHMAIAGVDAVQHKGTDAYFFLEVNAQPQLMTGAFIDKKQAMVGKLLEELLHKR